MNTQRAAISNSKITSAQLGDIANGPGHITLHNVEVVDPDQSVEIAGNYLRIIVSEEQRISSILKAIKSADIP